MVKIIEVLHHWLHECGYCGGQHPVARTAKHMLVCSRCGHW